MFIEEYRMVPNKWMTKIYQAFSKYCNTVYLFGDKNQCNPVEGHSQIHCNYFTSKTIMDMCPERVKLEYIEGCSRYDTKTREKLTKFLKTGKIQPEFPAIGKYYKNICYLNKTRRTVTEICCNEFVKNKKDNVVNFKYNGKAEHCKVAVGMSILVTQNLKRECMFNMVEFRIYEIDEHGTSFKVNNVWFEHNDLRQSFIPAFCCAVYKYQDADIKENYNILDVNRMDKKQLYTFLSRTTKFEYTHLNNQKLNRKYVPRLQPKLELMNSHLNSDFLYGKIYEVTFENSDKISVGLTCEKLTQHSNGMLLTKRAKGIKIANIFQR